MKDAIDGARRRWLRAGAALPAAWIAGAVRAAPPPRVVTVGGALTEIVYRLGAERLLVATDTTSTWPASARDLPKVGYQRALSSEGILALRPTLLLVTPDAGPSTALDQLRAAGVRIVKTRGAHTFESLIENVGTVAAAVDAAEAGAVLARDLEADWAKTRARIAPGRAPRVIFVLSHAANSVQVAGEGTAADAMIRYAGGVNALAGFQGYRPLTAEAAIAAAPDAILATREGIETLGGIDALVSRPGLALTPAGKAKRVVAPDALLLLGFGPRLPEAVVQLAQGFGTAR